MREILWLKEAEDELVAIVNYIFQNQGQNVALKVYDNIISQIELLSEYPELGTFETKYQYKGISLRVLHSKFTRIFYCIQNTKIVIVLLWNNRKDDTTIQKTISLRK